MYNVVYNCSFARWSKVKPFWVESQNFPQQIFGCEVVGTMTKGQSTNWVGGGGEKWYAKNKLTVAIMMLYRIHKFHSHILKNGLVTMYVHVSMLFTWTHFQDLSALASKETWAGKQELWTHTVYVRRTLILQSNNSIF